MRTTTTQKSSLYCCCFLAFGWRRGWFLRGYTTIKADSLTNESLYVYPGSNQTLKGNGTDQEKQQYLTFPPFHSPTGVHNCCYCGWVVLFFVFLFIIIWGGDVVDMPHRIEIKEFPSFFILLFHAILNDYFVGSLNNNNNKKIVVHVNFLSRHEFQRAHFLKKKKKMINQRFSIIKHLVVFDTQRVKRQQQKNTVDKERMYRYLFFFCCFIITS